MTCQDMERIEISPGVFMPVIGFGVFDLPLDMCESTCAEAIRVGWRHFDAAINYQNSAQVGAAINKSTIDRKEFFITTKIVSPPPSYEPQAVYDAVLAGIAELGLDYVDLYLIHTANLGGPMQRKTVWQALERLLESGKTRAIGVSNFGKDHLADLLSYCKIKPACNQIELHPWCQPASHIKAFQDAGIQLVAFSAIARGRHMDDVCVQRLARKYDKDCAQILLRWSLQKGFVPIVKSNTPSRILSNREVFDFELSEKHMRELDAKDTGDPPTGNTWNWGLNCK